MNGKILVLGDVHGRTIWKNIVDKENPDKVIFLGDYVSTHDKISSDEQLLNLNDILVYKENNLSNVILLRGNHDICELGYHWAECYPNEPEVRKEMSVDPLKSRFLDLTQWIYIEEDIKTIFSHAGVSEVWMKDIAKIKDIYDINTLIPSEIFGFCPDNYYDQSGYSKTQPPTWIRPSSLHQCNIQGWDQVVGHTPMRDIINGYMAAKYHQNTWFCDALEVNKYLVINNGEFIIKKYEN